MLYSPAPAGCSYYLPKGRAAQKSPGNQQRPSEAKAMDGPLVWGRQEEVDGWRKGPWTSQEDKLLVEHVRQHGEGRWNSVSKLAGTVSGVQ